MINIKKKFDENQNVHNCASALLYTRALHSFPECRKSGCKKILFFWEVFLSFLCARNGQALLKNLDVRLLLRFLNVLDLSCEISKNCFDVIQICRVLIIQRLSSLSVLENNLSTEDELFKVVFVSL